MKRVIAFLILLTVPIGFLTAAHKTVDGIQDDVFITPVHVYGDPKRVEGVTFQTLTTCGNHMWWYTGHTPGDPGATEAKFLFSQVGHGFFEREYVLRDFSLTTTGGMGMSTSGGDGLKFGEEGIGLLVNAVADKTPAGESREETLLLEDYFDYYPLDYWATFHTEDYCIDEMHESVRTNGTMDAWEEASGSYEQWIENFRFPIQTGDSMSITVGKDALGAIREIGINMDGSDNSAAVSFTTIAVKYGMYFSPMFQRWDGETIETGEYVYGHGLYYIPFKPVGHTEGTPPWMTFDFDGLEMVYSLESSDRLLAMEESADGQSLHLLANEDGRYIYCLFDIESRELISRTEIMATTADARWAFYPEQELLFLLAGGQMALVQTGGDSGVEFVTAWPEEAPWIVPSAVRYTDGILYGASLEWYEKEGSGVCLIACGPKGLGYMGYYISNLDGTGYNSAWINLESVEFVPES